MSQSLKERLFQNIKRRGAITAKEVCVDFGISRNYANILLRELREEGEILLVGKTNRAKYILASDRKRVLEAKQDLRTLTLRLKTKDLDEDAVFKRIEAETGILLGVREPITAIFQYAFTEIVNNAIDHSRSSFVDISCRKTDTALTFVVRDFGIGIFNNIQKTFRIPGTLAAIQTLLTGKVTTDPEHHSGQGVFFTSKMADTFMIDSFEKRLTINNLLPDLFISDRRILKGTRVSFSIHLTSTRRMEEVFSAFTNETDDGFAFDKTRVTVKLFQFGERLPSRSEAKRVTMNLENFREVELDFTDVQTIGQAFADEIFRVWHGRHPKVSLIPTHANENVAFMIKRAGGTLQQK
ncbi:DUF4325 domain-containing protein [Candidatus Uhrbacteria bacterium]|nr:DUF4325 domain-containing protein [Candidatus Uhrbacteria bacterium]MBD3284066.1 DUF4325 domain-containing protein [Candidatus Uhrbacteria bacterium]